MTVEQIIKIVDKVNAELVDRYPNEQEMIDLTCSMINYEVRKGDK